MVKIAKVLEIEIEAFELLKPHEESENSQINQKNDKKVLLAQFSKDLAIILQDSMEKALDYVKKQYDLC